MEYIVNWHRFPQEIPINGGHFLVVAGGVVCEAEYLPLSNIWVDPVEGYVKYSGVTWWAIMPKYPTGGKHETKDSK